jgi:hypothetical protein
MASRIAEGSNSNEDYDQMVQLLSKQANILQVEFASVVSNNFTIRAGANNDRRGEMFNPSGLSAKAMSLRSPLAATVTMNYSEFAIEGAPRYL